MPVKKKRLFSIIFVLMLCSCGSGQQKLPELNFGDGGLISGTPCSAPCFWNIIPGTTTEEEAVSILASLGDVQGCEYSDKIENGADKLIRCDNLGITFNDKGLVSRLGFNLPEPATVGDIIEKYGVPDSVIVLPVGPQFQEPYKMNLLYGKQRMVVGLPEQKSDRFELTPTIIIGTVLFCEEDVYKKFTGPEFNHEWKGFGKY